MSANKKPERFGPTVYLSETGSTTVSSVRFLQMPIYHENQLADGRESQHYGLLHVEFARRPELNVKIGGVSVVPGDRNEISEDVLDFEIKEIDGRLYAVHGRDLVQIGARSSSGDRILDAEIIVQQDDLPVLAHRAPVTLTVADSRVGSSLSLGPTPQPAAKYVQRLATQYSKVTD